MAGNYAPNYYGSGSGATAAEIVAAIKADPELGTADGGLVSNAAMLGVAIDGYTFTEAQRLMLAAMVGPITGGGTGTNVIKGADESKARITGTYDSLGNRTQTEIDAT